MIFFRSTTPTMNPQCRIHRPGKSLASPRSRRQQHATVLTAAIRHAFDDARNNIRRQLSRRDVIEKEKRARALDQNVVDAMIDEIASDRVVYAGRKRDLQVRADAIGGRDEHRLRQVRESAVKHSTEASDFGKRSLVESSACEFFDLVSRACGGVDVHTRVAV